MAYSILMPEVGKLPEFLVLGAAKAGTTALFKALARHPRVFASPKKEPGFFAYAGASPQFPCHGGAANAATLVTNEADYRRLFAGCAPDQVAGEASTVYLASDTAPGEAFRLVPRARLVAILRHPVERGYSQWLHLRHEGHEPIADFEAAWDAEPRRAAQGYRPAFFYRSRGFYSRQLARWLELFAREQLLVLFYEDWVGRPSETLAAIFRHLGIEPLPEPRVTRENRSSRQPRWRWLHHRMVQDNALRRWAQQHLSLSVRDAITGLVASVNLKPGPRLDPALRAKLALAFHDDLRRVEDLTQRDLSAWRT